MGIWRPGFWAFAMLLAFCVPLDVNAADSADVSVAVVPPADGVLTASIIGSSFRGVTYVPVGREDQIAQGNI